MKNKIHTADKIEKEEVSSFLHEQAEESFQTFSSGLLPNTKHILGVRLPVLRKFAKQLIKRNWRDYIQTNTPDSFEEIMLCGMIIGYAKDISTEERLQYISEYVPLIDNWSVCDSFSIGLKFVKHNQQQVWDFLQSYLESDKEFAIRFGIVVLLNYYINETYIKRVIRKLDEITNKAYYVQMAVAWALSMCFVQYPELVMPYLENNHLDNWTYHKTLQKICESLQVDKETKKTIKSMKRH